jgi:hypothetical protein
MTLQEFAPPTRSPVASDNFAGALKSLLGADNVLGGLDPRAAQPR